MPSGGTKGVPVKRSAFCEFWDSEEIISEFRDSPGGASCKSKLWDFEEVSKAPALGPDFCVGSCVQFVPEGMEFWEF